MSRLLFVLFVLCSFMAHADWEQTLDKARGQQVYFNAWGGNESINQYIRWVSEQVDREYGVSLRQVKITDSATVVSRILAENKAGRISKGSVDLVWVNGENFHALKSADLLYGPFAEQLPNANLYDTHDSAFTHDFGSLVEGMESPWGFAQLTFFYDSDRVTQPPSSMAELAQFAEDNPGRFSYPAPPDFHGSTFIKQALIELISDPDALSKPVSDQNFAILTKPLWQYLDDLHPYLWRSGRRFPSNIGQIKQLVNDGELVIGFTFNPNEPAASVLQGELPESTRSYVHGSGTVGNTHFVAIPKNSASKEGAMVVANFLLSAQAQAKKADVNVWGDPSVLDLSLLNTEQRGYFSAVDHLAFLPEAMRGQLLSEPHVSWISKLEKAWRTRYLP